MYKKYNRNYKDIDESFDNLLYSLLQAIKVSDKLTIKTNTRLLIFLLGAYTETFLNSFLYESHYDSKEPYFSDLEIKGFNNIKEQEKRWEYVIKIAMEKKLKKSYNELDRIEQLVYDDILNTFIVHILPIIRLRNKIAHGNWTCIISGADEKVYKDLTITQALFKENYLSLKHKKKLLLKLKELLVALISKTNTIDENYRELYPKIEGLSSEIDRAFNTFIKWKEKQQENYRKAEFYKNKNMNKLLLE